MLMFPSCPMCPKRSTSSLARRVPSTAQALRLALGPASGSAPPSPAAGALREGGAPRRPGVVRDVCAARVVLRWSRSRARAAGRGALPALAAPPYIFEVVISVVSGVECTDRGMMKDARTGQLVFFRHAIPHGRGGAAPLSLSKAATKRNARRGRLRSARHGEDAVERCWRTEAARAGAA